MALVPVQGDEPPREGEQVGLHRLLQLLAHDGATPLARGPQSPEPVRSAPVTPRPGPEPLVRPRPREARKGPLRLRSIRPPCSGPRAPFGSRPSGSHPRAVCPGTDSPLRPESRIRPRDSRGRRLGPGALGPWALGALGAVGARWSPVPRRRARRADPEARGSRLMRGAAVRCRRTVATVKAVMKAAVPPRDRCTGGATLMGRVQSPEVPTRSALRATGNGAPGGFRRGTIGLAEASGAANA